MVWRLIAWFVLALARRRVALAGDLDRERAAAQLREGYAGGYLTLDEFSRRTGHVLSARSLFGVPRPSLFDSVREVVLAVVTGAYVVFTLVLAIVLALALLLGASSSTFVVFALVWAVPTYLFARFRRRHARL